MTKRANFFTVDDQAGIITVTITTIGGLEDDEARIQWDELLENKFTADTSQLIVLIDLSQIDYFGSILVELMVVLWKRLGDKPRMVIFGASDLGQQILKTARFDTIWPLFPTREEAIQTLTK